MFVELYNVLCFVVHIERRDLIAREINVCILGYAAGRTELRNIFPGIISCSRTLKSRAVSNIPLITDTSREIYKQNILSYW